MSKDYDIVSNMMIFNHFTNDIPYSRVSYQNLYFMLKYIISINWHARSLVDCKKSDNFIKLPSAQVVLAILQQI